jgi:hypothetical protein
VERIPPALMCAVRFLIAGVFMLAFCGFRGRNIRYSPRQLAQMATVGVLLLMGGNLTLSYAEKYVASGLAALIVAVTPLWFLVLDTLLLGDHHVSVRGKAGLGLGILGLVVLLWPDLTTTTSFGRVQLWASISLLGGSFSWALGSVLAKRWKSADVDPFLSHGLADDRGRLGESVIRHGCWRFFASGVDAARNRRHIVFGGLRIVDRIHRVYLVVEPCAHRKSFHLRLRKSSSRGFSGMAGAERACGQIYPRRQRDRGRFGDSRD